MAKSSFWEGAKLPIAIAHRGGGVRYGSKKFSKENTLAAFRESEKQGFKYLELDVVSTLDNKIVVLHVTMDIFERRLHRKDAPEAQEIQSMTYSDMKKRLSRDVPTLEDIINNFPKAKLLIDAKTDEVVEPLVKQIIKLKAMNRVFLNSFYYDRVAKLQKLTANKVPCGLIIARYPRLINRKLHILRRGGYANTNISTILLPYKFLNKSMVKLIHQQDQKMIVWKPNTERKINKAVNLGVDGIISDNTELLKEVFVSRDKW